jgi:hypothetical protein
MLPGKILRYPTSLAHVSVILRPDYELNVRKDIMTRELEIMV